MPRTAVASVAILLAAQLAVTAAGAQVRGATLRARFDQRGDLMLVGNALMTCTGGPACLQAQYVGGTQNNNDFTMAYVDADGDATTFNSSGASISLPPGAVVSAARLYWFGTTGRGVAPPDPAARNQVLFKPDGGAYATVTAGVFDQGLPSPAGEGYGLPFLAQADVTSRVPGGGSYWVGNLQCAANATGQFGGWVLAVAYRDDADSLRSLRLYDAYDQVVSGHPVSLALSGLLVPPSGSTATRLGIILGDGDAGTAGDGLTLDGSAIANAVNPANNVGNSSVSRFGLALAGRIPACVNTLGFDADVFDAGSALPNGATTATLALTSDTDNLLLGVFGLSTRLFAPSLETAPAGGLVADDVNGVPLLPGDVLQYTLHVRNTGPDAAEDCIAYGPIPAGTTFVSGSLIVGGAPATDAAGDDAGEYDDVGNRVVARMGSGATSATGGNLDPHGETAVTFQVTTSPALASGTVIQAQALLDYAGAATGPGNRYSRSSDGDLATPGDQLTIVAIVAGLAVGEPQVRSGLSLSIRGNPAFHAAPLAIDFVVPEGATAKLGVFGVGGALVATLLDGAVPRGAHGLRWRPLDDHGHALPPGVYFLSLEAPGWGRVTRPVVLR